MEWTEMAERMEAALATMEAMAARWAESQTALAAAAEERVGRIVATVESEREAEPSFPLPRACAEATAWRTRSLPAETW